MRDRMLCGATEARQGAGLSTLASSADQPPATGLTAHGALPEGPKPTREQDDEKP